MINYPQNLNFIFQKLHKHHIKPIIVGGFVRDSILNIDSKDIDIELYGISSLEDVEQILEEFGEVNSVGKSFGVCKLRFENLEIDFSLPRTEKKISVGHQGFEVTTSADIDFTTASRRRDFTINSMGYDIFEKKLLDPFNGMQDLQNKILECVDNDTFIEDPLRVLRAVQFSARFNFKLSDNLFKLCKMMIQKDMLNELSSERVFEELKKLLFKAEKPSIGLKLLNALDSKEFFMEFTNLDAIDRLSKTHIKDDKSKLAIFLAILVYSQSYSHQQFFILKLSSEINLLKKISSLLKNSFKDNMNNSELYRLAVNVNIEELLYLSSALYPKNKELYKNIKKRAVELNILNKKMTPLIQGRDLIKMGLKPSLQFSKILQEVYDAQMDELFCNYTEALNYLEKKLSS